MKLLTILSLVTCSVFGQSKLELQQLFPIDAGHSYVEFSIRYMGYAKVKGRFADFSGLVRFDKEHLDRTSATVSIKVESLDTDMEFRDNDLKSENWFDAKAFPLILFKSRKAIATQTGFDLTGDITMKGITKEITIKMEPPFGVVKDVRADLQVIFTGVTTLDRTAFGVEGKKWSGIKEGVTAVANEVRIEISILGKQMQQKNLENFVNFTPGASRIYPVIKEKGIQAGLTEFKTQLDSKSVEVQGLVMIGKLLCLEGKLDDAQLVYEANKAAFPDQWQVYYSLGELSLLRNNLSGAKAWFTEAQKRDPENISIGEVLRNLN